MYITLRWSLLRTLPGDAGGPGGRLSPRLPGKPSALCCVLPLFLQERDTTGLVPQSSVMTVGQLVREEREACMDFQL